MVGESDHRVAGTGPPVAIALSRLVAGERQRRPLVDQHDTFDVVADSEVKGSRNTGNSGAAYYYVSGLLAHCAQVT